MNKQEEKQLPLRDDVVAYFQSYAQNQAGMGRFASLSIATLLFLLVDLFFLYYFVYSGLGPGFSFIEFMPWYVTHICVIGFTFIFAILTSIPKLLYKFQILFSTFYVVLGVVLEYSVSLVGFDLFVISTYQKNNPMNTLNKAYLGLIIWGAIAFLGYVGFAIFLSHIIRHGISAQKTAQNNKITSSAHNPKNLIVIFVFSMIASIFARVGGSVLGENVFYIIIGIIGMCALIFLGVIMLDVPFEAGFLAYLKWRDRRFWQEAPKVWHRWTPGRKKKWRRRAIIWGSVVVVLVVAAVARRLYLVDVSPVPMSFF
jgi:hypothetical protein